MSTEKGILEIDLHGMTSAQAEEQLARVFDQALLGNAWCIRIVHGRGTGRLKKLVFDYFSGYGQVRRIENDPINPGITKIFL